MKKSISSIINGKEHRGGGIRQIVYPHSSDTRSSFEYADKVETSRFQTLEDVKAWKKELQIAADELRQVFSEERTLNRISKIVANETGSPVQFHKEDMRVVQEFLTKLTQLDRFLPKGFLSEPKGNVLLVLCANEPITVTTILAFTALWTGNVVYIKPSSKTPTFAYFLVKSLAKHPALRKRLHLVLSDRKETERLIAKQSFDFVLSFGSRATSKALRKLCAEAETEFLEESEGNDWSYVDRDNSSLLRIATILKESFTRHNGQMCNAVRGVLVHKDVYVDFIRHLQKEVSLVHMGNPLLIDSRAGALLAGTVMHVANMVQDARNNGGKIVNYSFTENSISPTLIFEPNDDCAVISEGIFGPVLWVKPVGSAEEAIDFYNKKNMHGLGFTIFSRNKKVADILSSAIRAGRININNHPLHIGLFDPLGGVKLSGKGGPHYWVEKLTNRKFIAR